MIRENFIECIQNKKKARIIYFSKKDNVYTTRIIAPLDIWPWEDPKGGYKDNGKEKYWFFDFTWSNVNHITPKNIEDISSLEVLDEIFTLNDIPNNVIQNNWFIPRNW